MWKHHSRRWLASFTSNNKKRCIHLLSDSQIIIFFFLLVDVLLFLFASFRCAITTFGLWHNKQKPNNFKSFERFIHSIKPVWSSTRFVLHCPWKKKIADWKEVVRSWRETNNKWKLKERNVFYLLSLFIWCSVIIFKCCKQLGVQSSE